MNKRVIESALFTTLMTMLLAGVIIANQRQGQQNTNQQNRNAGQQNQNTSRNRNQNTNSNTNVNVNENANANPDRNMNGNANANMNDNGNTNSNPNMNTGGNRNGNANQSMNRNMSGENMNRDGAGQSMTTGASASLNATDRQFVMMAAMSGMAEVELGRLAAERGASDAVKQFGQRMVDDHSRANSELMQLASAAGITLPTELDAKHRATITKMSQLSGAAFDRAYQKEMVKEHNNDVALFQREAARGAHADLKSFAAKTLPTLQEHQRMARTLLSGSGGSMHSNMNMNRSTP